MRGVRLHLHYGDLSDSGQLTNLIYNIKPDEIYHLGAQSHVRVSFDILNITLKYNKIKEKNLQLLVN